MHIFFFTCRYTVIKETYENGASDRIVKPQRDKHGALIKQNLQVKNNGHYHFSVTNLQTLKGLFGYIHSPC